eukprot:6200843-Pleurochrysis_carterae.AAC.1
MTWSNHLGASLKSCSGQAGRRREGISPRRGSAEVQRRKRKTPKKESQNSKKGIAKFQKRNRKIPRKKAVAQRVHGFVA